MLSTDLAVCEPRLTISESTIPGITLTSSTSPDFASLMARAVGPAGKLDLSSVFPYAAILENSTDKGIMLVSVRWTGVTSVGVQTTRDMQISSILTSRPTVFIPPHAPFFISMISALSQPLAVSQAAVDEAAADFREYAVKQSLLTLSLETVVFSDGQIAGPDRTNAAGYAKAHLQAERDLRMELDELLKTGASDANIDFHLHSVRSQGLFIVGGKESNTSAATLLRAAKHHPGQSDIYVLLKAVFATELITSAETIGTRRAAIAATARLSARTFPSLHR